MSRWVSAFRLGPPIAALASAFACRQVVGIPDESPGSTVVNACGLPYGTTACASCAATSCCPESSACAADPVCTPYEDCYGNCKGDWQCRSQCMIDHTAGRSDEVANLRACLSTHCETACGLTCGGLAGDISVPSAASACQKCGADNGACTAERACASSADCTAFQLCEHSCETFDCNEACVHAHPSAEPLDRPYRGQNSPFDGVCSGPCAFGANWTCLGDFSWPAPKSNTTTLTVDVADYSTPGSMLSGVDVSVCSGLGDPNCPSSLAHTTTDAAGRAVMQVSNVSANFVGLDGYLQLSSPGYVPTLWYWGFPLSEANLSLINWDFSKIPVSLTSPANLASLGLAAGAPPLDPTQGVVVAVVVDCHASPAAGVEVSAGGLRAYYGIGTPNETATDSTNHLVTFTNVPVGRLELTAMPVSLNKVSSRRTVNVRANTLTFTYLIPTP